MVLLESVKSLSGLVRKNYGGLGAVVGDSIGLSVIWEVQLLFYN